MTKVEPEGATKSKEEGELDKDQEKNTLPTDQMANGPVPDRGCTDILCCLIFVAFLVGMVGSSGYGYLYGDPNLLLTSWDGLGRGCGYNDSVIDYPYLYFPTIDLDAAKDAMANARGGQVDLNNVADLLRFGNCVKECPKGIEDEVIQCKPTNYTSDPDYYKKCVFYMGGTSVGKALRYPTKVFAGKFCVPDIEKAAESGNDVVAGFKE